VHGFFQLKGCNPKKWGTLAFGLGLSIDSITESSIYSILNSKCVHRHFLWLTMSFDFQHLVQECMSWSVDNFLICGMQKQKKQIKQGVCHTVTLPFTF
jgi:hypothetical protein